MSVSHLVIAAAKHGDLEYLKSHSMIISFARDTEIQASALYWSAYHRHRECVDFILKKWPHLLEEKDSQSGQTPLHVASANGHFDVVSLLMACDSSILQIADKDGAIPLSLASRNGHTSIVSLITIIEKIES